ncbi:MAG: hypothetical protein IKS19_05065 [Clostridia bacterium]|nr:hypothetical protein [Clostridia bacterium]
MSNNSFERVLVCITDQYSCERLIKRGKAIADSLGLPLQVINVQSTQSGMDINGDAMEYLYKKAVQSGAEMIIYYNDEPALITAGHIKKYNVKHVVTGMPANAESGGFIQFLHGVLPEVPITVVPRTESADQYITMLPVYRIKAALRSESGE